MNGCKNGECKINGLRGIPPEIKPSKSGRKRLEQLGREIAAETRPLAVKAEAVQIDSDGLMPTRGETMVAALPLIRKIPVVSDVVTAFIDAALDAAGSLS